ncbi:P1 family peptidase [Nocardioides daejeonensis]|uniref:P1 family peptidase n=1 Tax=Nocardioides daejeonensis TaxID=1046556 RepID=UPI000D74308A|nr:P1 family peptidase [Nocardioides daejeonensis]
MQTNTLVDVPGIRVGHAQRVGDGWLSGTTVVLAPQEGAVAGVDVRGGGPGTRETDLLDPRNLVERVHAVTLTGGSALGLAAVDGVVQGLFRDGVGFPMGGPGEVVPIVPGAVIYDLGRGGVFAHHPDAPLGAQAYAAASADAVALGTVGAGTGARVGGLKGGVGSASTQLADGTWVAALVVVNAVGSAVDPATGDLWGARHCRDGELPGLRRPDSTEVEAAQAAAAALPLPLRAPLATTIGVIATDATLTKAQCQKMSGIGHDGLARSINPVHTMFDGDTLFTMATCAREPRDVFGFQELLTCADDVVTRSVVRAVLAATSTPESTPPLRSYREAFPSAFA